MLGSGEYAIALVIAIVGLDDVLRLKVGLDSVLAFPIDGEVRSK